jgi:Arc/MetJ-type ribon-helix-helix transcriptional regulator
VTVHLSPGIERIVKDAVRSGQYRSAEEVVSEESPFGRRGKRRRSRPRMNAAIDRLKSFGKVHQLSLGGMTIKQLRDEARP